MGQNQRRAFWWRLMSYLDGSGFEAREMEMDMEDDPYGGPTPKEPASDKEFKSLREEARKKGVHDGRSGMYDEWSLSTGSRPPYLTTLEARREEATAHERVREMRDLERLEQRVAVTQFDLSKCQERVKRITDEIDSLRSQEKDIQHVLSGHSANEDSRDGAARLGAAGRAGHRWAEPTRTLRRRALGGTLRFAVLVLFVAVELPIQYATFLYLGEDSLMTWAFVIGTAGAMLVAPHLAGGWTRRMKVEGWRSPLLPSMLIVLAGWSAGVWLLAVLRTAVLFVPTIDSVTLQPVVSTIDALKLGHIPVTVLFASLLTISGVVTFTFGYLGENPYAGKLADLQRERKKLERTLAGLEGRKERDEYIVGLTETRIKRHRERWQAYIEATSTPYRVCAALYLHAVADTMRNPAFTESASQWLRLQEEKPKQAA
ncbi:hypothetical protein [Sphaerisporangium aureirubrum]|uniref:Uncharacterized protein n=1 Tax=Sphaerisporangium aureirubrum TaxID=1544736 RepID=A0ABW1NGS2_9ACTN